MEMYAMPFEPPCPVSYEETKIKVTELEPILRPPESPLLKKTYVPSYLDLPDGDKMVIRQATREDIPVIVQALKSVFDVEKDFYDLVAVRTCGEILAWKRYRVKDHVCLIGVTKGELTALTNYRLITDKIASSYHTITFKRGGGIGAAMFLEKTDHALEALGCDEWWSTYESYTGIRYWGIGLAQQQMPWPEFQHELGGARVFFTTKESWRTFGKPKYAARLGKRPCPHDLLKQSQPIKVPSKIEL